MGCNTVETYVAWNVHEPYEGEFHFEGEYDLCRFMELAQELGLYVILSRLRISAQSGSSADSRHGF